VQSWSDLSACDHMLIYLNALTWTHDPEPLAAEIREAQRMGFWMGYMYGDAHGPANLSRISFSHRSG